MTDSDAGVGGRVFLIGFGALAAFCLWVLADSWGADLLGARVFLTLFSFSAVFFGVALAVTGPVSVGRAVLAGLMVAVPISTLISWAGFRFDEAGQFLDDPRALAVAGVMVVLATPFVSVWMSQRERVFDYATLFDTAWTIAVRYVAGWLFVGVFWVIVFLSNSLLELVDIEVIQVLFEVDWVRFALSGAVLGLGLAVAFELREYVSPLLLLRLLRLLLPIVLGVVAVFIAALPFRGLSHLFGEFSSAGTLMGVAIAAISLISVALDRDDADGINTPGMKAAARALAMTVPVLSGLALWSVVLRVQQYQWTPERVLAITVAAVLLIYGLTYAIAALRGRGWRGAIRRGNVTMALIAMVVAALWLTPVLNAERISAQSQLARFETGGATPEQLPLWEMANDWGHAGQAALAALEAQAQQAPDGDLSTRLSALAGSETRFDFEQRMNTESALIGLGQLVPLMAVRPVGAIELTEEMFAGLPDYRLTRWQQGCARQDGGGPSCVWVSGAFLPGIPANEQAVILFHAAGRVVGNHVTLENGQITDRVRELYDMGSDSWAELPADAIARVLSGDFEVVPSGVSVLQLDKLRLLPGN